MFLNSIQKPLIFFSSNKIQFDSNIAIYFMNSNSALNETNSVNFLRKLSAFWMNPCIHSIKTAHILIRTHTHTHTVCDVCMFIPMQWLVKRNEQPPNNTQYRCFAFKYTPMRHQLHATQSLSQFIHLFALFLILSSKWVKMEKT